MDAALGAGGRRFKSCRPDHIALSSLFEIPYPISLRVPANALSAGGLSHIFAVIFAVNICQGKKCRDDERTVDNP